MPYSASKLYWTSMTHEKWNPKLFSLYYLLKFNLERIIFLIPGWKFWPFAFPFYTQICSSGLPKWHSGKESIRQCRRRKRYQFHCLVGKVSWCMIILLHILAWKIPWTEKPGELQSMGPQRVGHNWVTEHYISTNSLKVANTWKCPIPRVNFNQKLESRLNLLPSSRLNDDRLK